MKTQILTLIIMTKTVFFAPGQVSMAQEPVMVKCQMGVPPQEVWMDMPAFVQIVNEVNAINGGDCCDIIIANTAFVAKSGVLNSQGASIERFNHPFLTIQEAVTLIGPAGANTFRTVIVYPGDYTEDITLLDNTNIFFHPGANVIGNITLSNGCHLHFSNGCTLTGNIISSAGVSNITGHVVHDGTITLTGTANLTAYGKQIYIANVTDATFNCYFEKVKADVATAIFGDGTSTINIYGLKADASTYNNAIISFRGTLLNVYNIDFTLDGAAVGVYVDGGIGNVYDSKILSEANCVGVGIAATLNVIGCHLESTTYVGGEVQSTAKLVLRRNTITVANSVNANQDAIFVTNTSFLVIEGNTLIAKGTGNSVIGSAAVNIKSLIGNGSNKAVNANVTETISTIFVDANYE